MPLRKGFRTAWPHIAALPCPTIGLGWAVPPWGGQAAPCVLLATQFSAKQPLRVCEVLVGTGGHRATALLNAFFFPRALGTW